MEYAIAAYDVNHSSFSSPKVWRIIQCMQGNQKPKVISVKAGRINADGKRASVTIVAAGSALTPEMGKLMTEIANDKKKSDAFLKSAGILTKSGKLSRKYA